MCNFVKATPFVHFRDIEFGAHGCAPVVHVYMHKVRVDKRVHRSKSSSHTLLCSLCRWQKLDGSVSEFYRDLHSAAPFVQNPQELEVLHCAYRF